jgi:hypothetical protein
MSSKHTPAHLQLLALLESGAKPDQESCEKFVHALYRELMERIHDGVKMELKMEVMSEISQLLTEHLEPVDGEGADTHVPGSDAYACGAHSCSFGESACDGVYGTFAPIKARDDIFSEFANIKYETADTQSPDGAEHGSGAHTDSDGYREFAESAESAQDDFMKSLEDNPIFRMVNSGLERAGRGISMHTDEELLELRRGRYNPSDEHLRDTVNMDVLRNIEYEERETNPEYDELYARKFGSGFAGGESDSDGEN